MEIEIIKVGVYETNCYILNKENNCLIIDPGDEINKIEKRIKNKLVGVIITHHHFDHIGAIDIAKKYNTKIYDYSNLNDNNIIENFKFKKIDTKGHTNDSITIYFEEEKIMFTGDFLFKLSIGRTDLGGNDIDMNKSIQLIKKYPNDITIYPGHGDNSNLGYEKVNNIYLT